MGAISVSVNGLTVVHMGSRGKAQATIPDICKTPFPPPVGTVPLPYPNTAEAKDLTLGSIITMIDGQSIALFGSFIAKSKGDKTGKLGGIISSCTEGEGIFMKFSPNVMVECRPVCRKTDMMIMNKINTISFGGMDQDDLEEPTEEKGDLNIELLDKYGNPIPDERYIVKFADGTEESGQLDSDGKASLTNVPVGVYKVQYPDLDDDVTIKNSKKKA